MIIVNITILFFLTTIISSLLNTNKEGLESSKAKKLVSKFLLNRNSKQIGIIKSKLLFNKFQLNIALKKIKYWKKKIKDNDIKNKSETNEIVSSAK